jgi:hypothetical protein
MLQEEEARARKKVAETRKRANEIKSLVLKNDSDYKQKLLSQERGHIEEELAKKSILETKMK